MSRTSYNENPLRKANFVNKIFFWWLKDIISYGRKNDLKPSDIYDTMSEDSSESLRFTLERAWEMEMNIAKSKSVKPSLSKVIIKTYYWAFIKFASLTACYVMSCIAQPELFRTLMLYFDSSSTTSTLEAFLYATLSIICMTLQYTFLRHGMFQLTRLGMQIKIACSSLIYKKITKLRCSLSNDQNSASAISLLSIDVSRFEILLCFSGHVITLPLQLLGVMYFIYSHVGYIASVCGIALMMLQTMPLQTLYYKLTLSWRANQAANTDKRISLIDEIVAGIRPIKMYAWENHFLKRTIFARRLEIESFLKISYLMSAANAFMMVCHRVSIFIVTIICFLYNSRISVTNMLTNRQHFYNLRDNMCFPFFTGVRSFANVRVAIKRIEDFLSISEVNSSVKRIDDQGSAGTILIEKVTASWCGDTNNETLKNVTIEFLPERVYAVLGTTGCGKSSLLELILGELEPISGQVSVGGEISYANQEPWLFAASVRANILFGETCEEERYSKVVTACALLEDFNQLPDGDETLVGDRGISLSGGQCTRISLARAVYRKADIYLLDDPFAAVDSHVAKALRSQCIDGLLKNKTVILVTHNLQYLNKNDNIILLNDVGEGEIQFEGSVDDFQKSKENSPILSLNDTAGLECTNGIEDKDIVKHDEFDFSKNDDSVKSVDSQEVMAKGNMSKSVFFKYAQAGGYGALFILIAAQVLLMTLTFKFDFDMAVWTEEQSNIFVNQTIEFNNDFDRSPLILNWTKMENAVIIIGSILVLILSTSILQDILTFKFFYKANRKLHNNMFSHLIRTSLRFFEINPAGRIMNRLSEDIGILDNAATELFATVLRLIFTIFGSLVFIVIIGWWNFITVIITLLLFGQVSWMYILVLWKIKRLSGIAKSPVLNFITSTLNGLTTIRSFKAESFVMKEFDSCLDKHTAAYFLEIASTRGFSLWIDLMSISFFACTAYTCLALKRYGVLAGHVGLTLTTIYEVVTTIASLVKQLAETCGTMINVERILQFTNVEPEDIEMKGTTDHMPRPWPSKGDIRFEHVYMSYSEEDKPVLKGLCFSIEAGTKVGIVGRTGAGKSSLITALFRLAKVDGQLFIDNIDTQKVSLSSLRSKISIIPQEPIMFGTSLRSNLDPFNEYEDATLWSALDSVGLKAMFSSLEQFVEKGGKNLSLGQRQLLCLARVIVKNNNILVLDEATANVDSVTDTFIQETIRHKFKKCTVLIIAHRLNTIMDCDKVLVMNYGQVVEYDHPHVLLQNRNGHFSKMVEQTGESISQHLRIIAERAYNDTTVQSTYC